MRLGLVQFPTTGQEVYNGDFRYKCYHECEDFPVEYCPTNFGCALSRVAAPIDVHALPTADAPFAIDIEFRAVAAPAVWNSVAGRNCFNNPSNGVADILWDDGSTDRTINIEDAKTYCLNDPQCDIVSDQNNGIKNLRQITDRSLFDVNNCDAVPVFTAYYASIPNQLVWGYGEDQDGQPAANRLLLTGTGLRYEWTVGSCALEHSVGATDGLWHHARVSFDGARRSLFYDGALVHVEDETQASCANAYDGVAATDRQNAHVDVTNFALGTADLTLVQAAAPTAVQFLGAVRDFKAYDVAHAPLPRPTVFAHRAEEAFGGTTVSCDRARIRVDAAASKLPTGSEPYTVRAEFQCGAYAHDEAVLFSHGAVADNQLLSVSYHASTQTLTHAWGTSAATKQAKQFVDSLCDDAWHEVVVSWDGETKRMHLDGVEVAAEIVQTRTDVTLEAPEATPIGTYAEVSPHRTCFGNEASVTALTAVGDSYGVYPEPALANIAAACEGEPSCVGWVVVWSDLDGAGPNPIGAASLLSHSGSDFVTDVVSECSADSFFNSMFTTYAYARHDAPEATPIGTYAEVSPHKTCFGNEASVTALTAVGDSYGVYPEPGLANIAAACEGEPSCVGWVVVWSDLDGAGPNPIGAASLLSHSGSDFVTDVVSECSADSFFNSMFTTYAYARHDGGRRRALNAALQHADVGRRLLPGRHDRRHGSRGTGWCATSRCTTTRSRRCSCRRRGAAGSTQRAGSPTRSCSTTRRAAASRGRASTARGS